MVTVTKATHKEIHSFNETAWHGEDLAHYGRPVDWKEKKFRFKAEENGVIMGTISGKFESGVLYIGALIVDSKSRGKGIGQALMAEAEKFGKKLGAHLIWLNTGKDWEANKFYKKLGFTKIAELPNHYFNKDFVIYSKPIK